MASSRARALLVVTLAGGTSVYFNNIEVALEYVKAIASMMPADSSQACSDLGQRCQAVCAATIAHHDLNLLAGQPQHNLGLAFNAANEALSPSEKKALRSIRRKANSAKHAWQPPSSSTSEPSLQRCERKSEKDAKKVNGKANKLDENCGDVFLDALSVADSVDSVVQRIPDIATDPSVTEQSAVEEMCGEPFALPSDAILMPSAVLPCPDVATLTSESNENHSNNDDVVDHMQSLLDLLQSPIAVPAHDPSTESEVRDFYKQLFAQHASRVRSATDQLSQRFLVDGKGSEDDYKQVRRVGVLLLRDLQHSVDYAENEAIARVLTRLQPPPLSCAASACCSHPPKLKGVTQRK